MENGWRNNFVPLSLTSILLGASGFFVLGYFISKGNVIIGLVFFAGLVFLSILTLGGALADRNLERDIKRWRRMRGW